MTCTLLLTTSCLMNSTVTLHNSTNFGVKILRYLKLSTHMQQHHGLFRAKESKTPFKIGTAERKILITLCYYVVLGVITLASVITLSTRNVNPDVVRNYFLCEALGVDPENPCDKSVFEDRVAGPVVISLISALLGLLPAVNLIFTVNITDLKKLCRFTS